MSIIKTPADLLRWLQLAYRKCADTLHELSKNERADEGGAEVNQARPLSFRVSSAEETARSWRRESAQAAAWQELANAVSVAHDWLDVNPLPECPPRPGTLSATGPFGVQGLSPELIAAAYSALVRFLSAGLAAGGAAAGNRKRKPGIAQDEANVRARKALKDPPPKGKKRWSYRTLAKAIGCGAGQVSELSAWQAYAESHGLKRDKGQAAPKAVSLTARSLAKEDSAAALDRLRLAELERAAAQQIAEGEVDRKQYRRRRRV